MHGSGTSARKHSLNAKRQGLSPEKVRDAAGHTSVSTTEGYMRGFEVKEANLGLRPPKAKKAV